MDIVKTWHFATQTNVENLYSPIVYVLALVLKLTSGLIEFRDCGNSLCNYLLQDSQIQLLDKGLSASQAKEHLISPCLRLLTEIVTFDGGHAAHTLFRQRDITFKRLEDFLSVRKDSHRGANENRRKPSIRCNALRYLFANLKLQTTTAKMKLLRQRQIVRAIFEGISEDSPGIVLELLDVIKQYVALDAAISLHAKSCFFNEWVLSRLSTIYNYEETDKIDTTHSNVQVSVHKFLLFLCTSSRYGVLDTQEQDSPDVEDNEAKSAHLMIYDDLQEGNNRKGYVSKSRNSKLISFLQKLRPHANVLQSELILGIFEVSPLLMSDYFASKRSFSFEPKATATWIGYSSFLLAAMRLPLPDSLIDLNSKGETSCDFNNLLNTILPIPITQKVMTRCLNQSNKLIKALATKILTAAFEKFEEVLRRCRSIDESRPNFIRWHQIASDLTAELCNRVPDIEHIVAQFRNCTKDATFLKESFSRVLALYYSTLPQLAFEARLDVSVALSDMLRRGSEKNGLQCLEQDHLIQIARHSPNMQWWHKPGLSDALL